jgi:hypothetical protein
MSLFEITPEIQILAKPITPGWHGLEITKIEDKTTDKGVKQTVFTHKVIDGAHKGAFVFLNVNHDETMAYNLDYLNFITKGAFKKPGKVDLRLENVVKKFDGQIKNKTYEDRIMNNLGKVRPYTEPDKDGNKPSEEKVSGKK